MAMQPTSTPPKDPKLPANPFSPRRYGELQRVTDRVYIIRNITNSSFVIGDRSVALIDSQVNAPTAKEVLRLIRTVTSKPIEYVINTHYHWDHTNGNAIFKNEGATVVSSALTKDFMVSRAPRQKDFLSGRGFELGSDPYLPDITFENEHRLDLGHMPLRLFFAGKAESDDATAVHVTEENVLMSGDTVMTGSFPIFGQPVWDEGLQGDGQWEKTIANLMALKPAHIIPGHGPLAHEQEVATLLKIMEYFVGEVSILVKRGLSVREVLADLEGRLPSWMTSMPVVWGSPRYAILRVYRGLTKKATDPVPGWQQYKPSAIPSPRTSVPPRPGSENFADYRQMADEAAEGGDQGLRLAVLKNAAERFSTDPTVWAVLADALIEASRSEPSVLEKGDFFQEARQSWEHALQLDPAHVGSLLGKGRYLTMMAYRGGDDPSHGMEYLARVLELSTNETVKAEAEFYLGMGYRRLFDENKARAQFAKALRWDPAFFPARMALQNEDGR